MDHIGKTDQASSDLHLHNIKPQTLKHLGLQSLSVSYSLCDGVLRWKKPSLYDMDMEKQSLHSNTESWTWMLIKECTHWRCWLLQGVHTAIPLSTPAPSQLRIFRSQLYTSTKEWEISVKAYNVCVKSVFATRGACYLCDKVVQKSTWNQGQVVQVES